MQDLSVMRRHRMLLLCGFPELVKLAIYMGRSSRLTLPTFVYQVFKSALYAFPSLPLYFDAWVEMRVILAVSKWPHSEVPVIERVDRHEDAVPSESPSSSLRLQWRPSRSLPAVHTWGDARTWGSRY